MRNKFGVLVELAAAVRQFFAASPEEIPVERDEDDEPVNQNDLVEVEEALRRLLNQSDLWERADEASLFLPHDADASMVAEGLDQAFRQSASVRDDDNSDNLFGETLSTDPMQDIRSPHSLRAACVVYYVCAQGKKGLRRKHAFVEHDSNAAELESNARVILFGDWASGIPNARILADYIWQEYVQPVIGKKQQVHLIHLGDTYYAGLKHEYPKRFSKHWPVRTTEKPPNIFSWTIPGNHGVYAGPHGFYRMLKEDRRFDAQAKCSHFLIENKYWQIFGLDTSSTPVDWNGSIGVLHKKQLEWVIRRRDVNKKCILLTHHQPFCVCENVDPHLSDQLRPIREQHPVTAWFWGHEHLCARFEPHMNIEFPVLLGHAGFPGRPKKRIHDTPKVKFEWTEHVGPYVSFGFARLDFSNDTIDTRLMNLVNREKHRFMIY